MDSRKVIFKTKKINPLYVYFKTDNEITEKLKELSDQIKKRFKYGKINHSFFTTSNTPESVQAKITFKFKTERNVITTKIDKHGSNTVLRGPISATDKLIDMVNPKNSKIDVVVRFQIISNSYGNFLGMIMEKLTVK